MKYLRLVLLPVAAAGSAAVPQQDAPAPFSQAPRGAVRLFVSGGLRAPVLAVRAVIESKTGRPLAIESSESRTLEKQIRLHQPFEAALLTTNVVRQLEQDGELVPDSDHKVATVRVGVAVRGDAPRLDLSTTAGLRNALLGAHSIRRYVGVAASTPIVDRLFVALGVADQLKDRIVELGNGPIPAETPLARGEYELVVNLASAVIPMKGWTYLGLLPERFQTPLDHSIAIGAGGDAAAARQLIAVLEGPAFTDALRANGIDRR